MAIHPGVALGFRPPQLAPLDIQSPLDRYQKMLTLRHLMQQGQLGAQNIEQTQLENEALRQKAQDEQSLGSWMRQNQGRPDLTASEIVANHPNPTGLKVATAWSAQQKANMEAQSAAITNRLNTLKAIDREMQGITDNATKAAALSNAVTNKWMTGEQAAPYLSMDVTDPKWKDFTTRIQSQTMDGTQRAEFAAAEIKARIARNTEASTTAGTIAEGDKKVLDATQAQRASDAARVAAAFDLSPEAGAAVLRTLAQDPNRFAPFKDVTTAAQARNVGLTAEQQAAGARAAEQFELSKVGKTEPYPQPVQTQKVEEAGALASARTNVLETPEKIAQDLDKKRREAEIASTVNKALSGEASKVYAIATTMGEDINKLRAAFQKDYRGSQRQLLMGTDRDLRLAAERLADKVGRLRSGGAINKEEESRFMGQIASWKSYGMGDSASGLNALAQIEEEAGIVARSIRPQGESGTPGTATQTAAPPKVKVWNEKTNRFEER